MESTKLEARIYVARQVRFLLEQMADTLVHVSTVQSNPLSAQCLLT